MKGDWADPKGLIGDAYRIEEIGEPECRSIFLDWALSLAEGTDLRQALDTLEARHADVRPEHPMSRVLKAGRAEAAPAARRGGWRGRRSGGGGRGV